jgi:hypothetical protein
MARRLPDQALSWAPWNRTTVCVESPSTRRLILSRLTPSAFRSRKFSSVAMAPPGAFAATTPPRLFGGACGTCGGKRAEQGARRRPKHYVRASLLSSIYSSSSVKTGSRGSQRGTQASGRVLPGEARAGDRRPALAQIPPIVDDMGRGILLTGTFSVASAVRLDDLERSLHPWDNLGLPKNCKFQSLLSSAR